MRKTSLALAAAVAITGLAYAFWARSFVQTGGPPAQVEDFSLLDESGVSQTLSRHFDARAVVITAASLHEPATQRAAAQLKALHSQPQNENVHFFLINSNPENMRGAIAAEAREQAIPFPVLLDPSQVVARVLGLKRTGETVVLIPPNWEVVFRGGTGAELEAVLRELTEGKKPSARTEKVSGGEEIRYRQNPRLSYKRQIAPLVIRKCASCHSGTFPAPLTRYEQVKEQAEKIRSQLIQNRMPPFSADPAHGEYLNDGSLLPDQKRILVQWIESGAPFDGEDPLAAFIASRSERRERRNASIQPLYSVGMDKPSEIAPEGDDDYQYFQLGGPAPRDFWVTAVHFKTTQPKALRHASLYIVSKPLKRFEALARTTHFSDRCFDSALYLMGAIEPESRTDPNFIRMPVWGGDRTQPFRLPRENIAMRIPKGYYLILETHRRGSGEPLLEQSSIDFYGTLRPEGRKQLHGTILRSPEIEIPAGAKSHLQETPLMLFNRAIRIHAMMAHMHLRGHSVKMLEHRPDGSERVIASVPDFHYGILSHSILIPAEPIRLAAGSQLKAICEFDNSPANRSNPDPYNPVRLGMTKSGTEMCNLSVQYYFDD